MRSIDEQMERILEKARERREKERRRRVRAAQAATAVCGFAATLFAAEELAHVSIPGEAIAPQGYGSLILAGSAAGYVLVGTLAFVFGAAVTLTCVFLAKSGGKKEE